MRNKSCFKNDEGNDENDDPNRFQSDRKRYKNSRAMFFQCTINVQ